jgi:hypothetical protein
MERRGHRQPYAGRDIVAVMSPQLDSPLWLVIAVVAIPVAWWARTGWIVAGIAFAALGAAGPSISCDRAPRVAVFADRSASTRTAGWHDPDRLAAFVARGDASLLARLDEVEADAVVILTDGRDLPDLRGVDRYAVLDPVLDDPRDAAVRWAVRQGGQVVADTGRFRRSDAARVVVGDGTDPWPENDAMALPPAVRDRRLVRVDDAASLPAGYADVGAVIWSASGEPTERQADRLRRFVTNLGGTLVLATADRPARLEGIDPLSSKPPGEPSRWVVLVDRSGSMAGDRYLAARRAADAAVRLLPPDADVELATFAGDLRWLPTGTTSFADVPTTGGETDLPAALRTAVDTRSGRTILVLTDAETPGADAAVDALRDADARLLVVHVGERIDPSLESLIDAVEGDLSRELSPERFADAAADLIRRATLDDLRSTPASLELDAGVIELPRWRTAWPKRAATRLAGDPGEGPVAAAWRIGLGRVVSISGDAPPDVAAGLVRGTAVRSEVEARIDPGPPDVLVVHAQADTVVVALEGERMPLERVAPGRWAIELPAPRPAGVGVVLVDEAPAARVAVSSRYADEFSVIGNDSQAAVAWTGGADRVTPWPKWPVLDPVSKRRSLVPWLLLLAATSVGIEVIRRISRRGG